MGIIDSFDALASSIPNNNCISDCCGTYSYANVQLISKNIARNLLKLGIRRGDIVCYCADKDIDILPCILGILRAGATLLMISPSSPASRLGYMLQNTPPKLVITNKGLLEDIKSLTNATVVLKKDITCDRSSNSIFQSFDENAGKYIVYTSGSSGLPKAVINDQKALYNAVQARLKSYGRVFNTPLFGPISFDMSLMIQMQCMLSGGCVYIPDDSKVLQKEYLQSFFDSFKSIDLLCVPSFYMRLLEYQIKLPHIEVIITAGESFGSNLVDMHRESHPKVSLFNEYGVSECAICSSIGKVYTPDSEQTHSITIGAPIRNTKMFLLDKDNNISDSSGEVCISGAGVSSGYINEERLSKTRFINISHEGHTYRVYKTGDLGVMTQSGSIRITGRIDNQIKINGYRIEPEEIESYLNRITGVTNSVVKAVTTNKGYKTLIAYYTAEKPISYSEFLQSLRQQLPSYMIPGEFIHLQSLPSTSSGKIDRLTPIENKILPYKDHVDIQEEITNIWKTLLGLDQTSVYDDFFEAGGDSLAFTRLHVLLEQTFSVNILLSELIEHSSIEKLVRLVSLKRGTNEEPTNTFTTVNNSVMVPSFKKFQ